MRLDKPKIFAALAVFFVFALVSFALSFYPASSAGGWFTSRVYIHGSTPSAAAGFLASSMDNYDEETEDEGEDEGFVEEETECTEEIAEFDADAEFEFEDEEEEIF